MVKFTNVVNSTEVMLLGYRMKDWPQLSFDPVPLQAQGSMGAAEMHVFNLAFGIILNLVLNK